MPKKINIPKKELKKLVESGKTQKEIADYYDCSLWTVQNRYKKYNIKGKTAKKTLNEFKKEVFDLEKGEYTVLSEKYINNKTKIKMKHNNESCGHHEYYVTPHMFICGRRCPKCAKKKKKKAFDKLNNSRKKDLNEFKKEVKQWSNNQYLIKSKNYINNNTKLKFYHKKCKNDFLMTPNDFQQGHRCPYCAGIKHKTYDEFLEDFYNSVDPEEYEVVSNSYKNTQTKMEFHHKKCGNNFKMRPSDILRGQRCPHCQESKGERKIRKWLEKNNINFKSEFTFKECKNIRVLPFDFYVDSESLLIEFDGIQHYEIVEIFGGEKGLKETKRNDKIKNNFCKENGISLLRIPYWEYGNINKILNDYFY
jgi:very-short-patch-repair endonuclease